MASKKSESVKVVVRCRPLSEKEIHEGNERIVDMDVPRGCIKITNPKTRHGEQPREFTYDAIYDWNSQQRELYDETFRVTVDSVLEGYNGTIFAYGQTGTGKTFTMEGVRTDSELRGVIPSSFDHVFKHIARSHDKQFLVRASYLEIYQEEIKDLLSKDQKKRLELKERPDTGVYVKDLSSFVTKGVKEIEHVMNVGNQNRSVGRTNMNEHSSRSHAIFIVTVECSETRDDGDNHIRVGKLNMVDLAGSERQAKTGTEGKLFNEAVKINLSLSALGNVIHSLVDGKSTHIPYRDSKLTRLLQDSLGGNAKTVMVATIGPADYNYEETLTTLRYANRAKNIKNKPKINEDPKDALLREFQEEIARLKSHLSNKGKKSKRRGHRGASAGNSEDAGGDEEEQDPGQSLKEQEAQLESEKQALLQNENIVAEERDKLVGELQQKQKLLQKKQEARDSLASKIQAMESKLLVGGKTIIDHTSEQERKMEEMQRTLAQQKIHELEIRQRLKKQEGDTDEVKGTFDTLQQEVDAKSGKLKQLYSLLQAQKGEITDLHDEHHRQREELEETQTELVKTLKLKQLILESFVPPDEKMKVFDRAYYDEDEEEWKLKPLARPESGPVMIKRPVSAVGNRRPVSEYARMAAALGGNPRYKTENVLLVELDMPNRTTRDYEGPTVAPRVQAALDAALQDEDELAIDAGASSLFLSQDRPKAKRNKKRRNVRATAASTDGSVKQQFPLARGWVATDKRFA
ncbi:kinesin-II 95 kDa subunit-like isoform X2 [Corticium candelabrum]|uniref:kinesin-II 95 kDa subunit-like isoform X2 n=1 Tax=Corticium candelabrum TaxID=121492 RepID=UPI002E357593|nr:kinesin-II 95 kDa subunit-like isoform X2 [Corticium candelabrum]